MTPLPQDQSVEPIPVSALLEKVDALRKQGYRLVQISATRLPDGLELTYSFALEGRLAQFRLHLPDDNPRVPSISSIYWCAFLYENEMHDLFGLAVEGMAVDFKGTFYNTAIKFPFGSTKAPVAKPATTTATSASSAPAPTPPPGSTTATAT
ncbi:MAG TPA: NADH-quinone oxidoreductase subunit C [Candidatus Acidoferrum sp.]|nr:NADH-quinone oxidoreductase subunit C [Candidatus Acidoferrum sp.]